MEPTEDAPPDAGAEQRPLVDVAQPDHAQEARRAKPSHADRQPHLVSTTRGLHHPGCAPHKGLVLSFLHFIPSYMEKLIKTSLAREINKI